MDKKGFMGTTQKISLILGLVLLALGLIPILNSFGVIAFQYPEVSIVLWVLAVLGGLWLFIDAVKEGHEFARGLGLISFLVGAVLLATGLIPILYNFGTIGFQLPGLVNVFIDYIYAIAGLLLLIGGFRSGMF